MARWSLLGLSPQWEEGLWGAWGRQAPTAPFRHSPLAKWGILLLAFRSRLKINSDELISAPRPVSMHQRDSKMQCSWLPSITSFGMKTQWAHRASPIRAQPLLPGFLPLLPRHFSTSALILVLGPASYLPGGDACWWRPCVCRLLPLILFLLANPEPSS